jgi:L-ascorbate metabolism protein UlaG (beta-lactamase superfamily)
MPPQNEDVASSVPPVGRHPTDHFDGTRFFNPTRANGQPASAVPRMLAQRRTPWPDRVPVDVRPPPQLDGAAAAITFIGHSTFLIQTRLGNILTDPIYSERASPVAFAGPRRVRAPAIAFNDLPPVSIVLMSHNHYDHCDARTLRAIEDRWRPLVVTPLGNGRLLKSIGMRRVEELDWWDNATQSPVRVTATPAQHFSARTPFDRNRALWGGFAIEVEGRRILFAGDSGYAPHFREIRSRVGPPALALLPIGAYEPRWFMRDIHMNPGEAVQAHIDLGAERSVGMHFGTFQLTLEGIADPIAALVAARDDRGIPPDRFVAPGFGDSFRLPPAGDVDETGGRV